MKFGGLLKSPFPIDYAEADESQAGKSLRHRLVHTLSNEQTAVIQQKKKKGLGSYEEDLSIALTSGKPFVTFENFKGTIEMPMLESAIKGQGFVSIRLFNKEGRQVPSYDVIYQMNSNNASIGTDLANRSMIVRLIKRKPDYRFRRNEHELIAYVKARHEELLGCVFALIKDWCKRGCP